MKVLTVVGTRPELIRLSLVFRRLQELEIDHVLVHTGQNYDQRLSQVFFDELGLPAPDVNLGVKADRVGEQIGQIIDRGERALLDHHPDALLILGDTNSGLSAIAATRHGIPVFHLEAGNRCFDPRVPEERNRKLIDHISDWLLPYTPRARENLLAEGLSPDKVLVCGNPITEVLEHFKGLWEQSDILERLGESQAVTCWRPCIARRPSTWSTGCARSAPASRRPHPGYRFRSCGACTHARARGSSRRASRCIRSYRSISRSRSESSSRSRQPRGA